MSHQLILAETAKNTGATPEQLAVDWLAAMSRHAAKDPVEKWIGALSSNISDWTDQHDKYLGENLMETTPRLFAEPQVVFSLRHLS